MRGRYVPLSNLHVTLAFIGETDAPGAVKEALSHVSLQPFELSLSGMGHFRDLLWVGMEESPRLQAAAQAVRDALDQAGIAYDRKKFSPHITVVRRASGDWRQVPPPKGTMTVRKISLMKTTFKNGRPVYTEEGTYC